MMTGKSKHIRIPAEQVIHIFMPLRAGQTRGEPWLSPVMPAMKQLGGFREAAVINARIGASKMGFFTCLLYTSPSPRDGLLSRMPSSA